jgi:hypothetical protein
MARDRAREYSIISALLRPGAPIEFKAQEKHGRCGR